MTQTDIVLATVKRTAEKSRTNTRVCIIFSHKTHPYKLSIKTLQTKHIAFLTPTIPEAIKPEELQRKFFTHNEQTGIFRSKNRPRYIRAIFIAEVFTSVITTRILIAESCISIVGKIISLVRGIMSLVREIMSLVGKTASGIERNMPFLQCRLWD